MRDSRYSHKTVVDEKAGAYAVDCSGLAVLILRAAAAEQLAAIPRNGRSRPRAVEFYTAFSAAPADDKGAGGWRRVVRLMDARPGDLIAWRNVEQKPGTSTGHIVLVDEPPALDGKGRVRVAVIDATSSPHGNDTRTDGATGIGRGTMWFDVDSDGKAVGCRWKSRNGTLHEVPTAIGRAKDPG
ncbi:MAG: hypothetical protein NTW87_34110 [Planctomycetota bacterium]|nr:hypothetical protein [Planctomycetota bacterium]